MFLVSKKSLKIAVAMLGSTALTSVMAPAAYAQSQDVRSYNVPAQPLTSAAAQLSEQAGIQLVVDSTVGSGIRSGAVDGRMTSTEALQRMLAGTGLTWRSLGNSTITIEKPADVADGERVLGVVSVEGSQTGSYQTPVRGQGVSQFGGIRGKQDDEAVGYRAKVSTVATGTPVAIEDIPRAITVQTQEQIEKQDIVDIGDALRHMPGIAIQENPSPLGSTNIFSRGLAIQSLQLDGGGAIPLDVVDTGRLNLDAYERVELVRGPNSLFTGEGSPGGSINLVRKRPGIVPTQSLLLEAGSFKRVGIVGDISTPSLFGTPIGFRIVASRRHDGEEAKNYSVSSSSVYGIIDIPLGENARLEAGANFNHTKINGSYYGPLHDVNGGLFDLPRDFNIEAPGTGTTYRSLNIFSKLYIDIADDWDLELGFENQDVRNKAMIRSETFQLRADGSSALQSPGRVDIVDVGTAKPSTTIISGKITGRFETFGLVHNVFGGVTRTVNDNSARTQQTLARATITSLEDLRNPIYNPINGANRDYTFASTSFGQTGILIGDSVSWKDLATATVTLRRDTLESSDIRASEFRDQPSDLTADYRKGSGTWRPSFSVLFKPLRNLSIYGSFADGFQRQDQLFIRSGDAPNYDYTPAAPYTFENVEAGLKYANGSTLATLSLYRIKTNNVAYPLTGVFECPPEGLTSQCFSPSTVDKTSKGVDFEFTGKITSNLSAIASVNYNSSKHKGQSEQAGERLVSIAPQTAAQLFLDWSPPFVDSLSVQFGARYKSKYHASGEIFDPTEGNFFEYKVRQGAYAVFDAGLTYDISSALSIQFNVENLFDKYYISTPNPSVPYSGLLGAPQSFRLGLKWKGLGEEHAGRTGGFAPFGSAANWYLGVYSGYNLANSMRADAAGAAQDGSELQWDYETKNAPLYGAKVGYLATDNFAFELEGQYRSASFGSIGGNAVAPFGVCGAIGALQAVPFDCDEVPGKMDTFSLLANALYRFGSKDSLIRPYVGIGGGVSRNQIRFQGKMDGIGPDNPWGTEICFPEFNFCFVDQNRGRQMQEFVGGSSRKFAPSYQLIFGLEAKINDRLSIDASYRRFGMLGVKWDTYNLPVTTRGGVPPLTPALGRFNADYSSNTFTTGVRWALGSR